MQHYFCWNAGILILDSQISRTSMEALQQVYEPIKIACKNSKCESFLSGVHSFPHILSTKVKNHLCSVAVQIQQDGPRIGNCRNWVMSTGKLVILFEFCKWLKFLSLKGLFGKTAVKGIMSKPVLDRIMELHLSI